MENHDTPFEKGDSDSSENQNKLFEKLVLDAVKKIVSETPGLVGSSINPEMLLKKVDTGSILQTAMKQINSPKISPVAEAPVQPSNDKKHKLYLPPPDAPKYNPTPISVLNKNQESNSAGSCSNEYSPSCSRSNVKLSMDAGAESDSDSAKFSTDEDETEDEESKKEFDMLEEILTEHISNPARTKEINIRKQALSKQKHKEKLISATSKTSIEQKKSPIQAVLGYSVSKSRTPEPDANQSYFMPPSPVFTSSVYSFVYPEPQNTITDSSPIENSSPTASATVVSNCTPKIDNPPSNSTHRFLPKIAQMERPSAGEWKPRAQVEFNQPCEMVSVESMLAKLDGVYFEPEKEPLKPAKGPPVQKVESYMKPVDGSNSKSSTVISNKSHTTPNRQGSHGHLTVAQNVDSIATSAGPSKINHIQVLSEKVTQEPKTPEDDMSSKQCRQDDTESENRHTKRQKINSISFQESSSSREHSSSQSSSSHNKHKKHHRRDTKKSKSHKKTKKHKRRRSYSTSGESSSGSDFSDELSNSDLIEKESQIALPIELSSIKIEKGVENSPKEIRPHIKLEPPDDAPKNVSAGEERIICKGASESICSLPTASITPVAPCENIKKEPAASLSMFELVEFNLSKMLADSPSKSPFPSPNLFETATKPTLAPVPPPPPKALPPPSVSTPTYKKNAIYTKGKQFDMFGENLDNSQAELTKVIKQEKPDKIVSKANAHEQKASTIKTLAPKTSSTAKRPDSRRSSGQKENKITHRRTSSSHEAKSKDDVQGHDKERSSKSSHDREKGSTTTTHVKDKERSSKSTPHNNEKSSGSHRSSSKKSSTDSRHKSSDKSANSRDHKKSTSSHTKSSESSSSHTHHKDKEKSSSSSHHRSSDKSRDKSSSSSRRRDTESQGSHHKDKEGSSHSRSRLSSSDSKSDSKRKRPQGDHGHTSKSKRRRSEDEASDKQTKSTEKRKGSTSSSDANRKILKIKLENTDGSPPIVISDDDSLSNSTGSPLPDFSALDDFGKDDMEELFDASADPVSLLSAPPTDDVGLEDHNDPAVLEECMQIFSEFDAANHPAPICPAAKFEKKEEKEPPVVGRKRVPHVGANATYRPNPVKISHRKTPGQVLLERYEKMKKEQKVLQQKLEEQQRQLNEVMSKTPSGSSVTTASVVSSSMVSSTSGVGSSMLKKRVARAPNNVQALISSKNRMLATTRNRQLIRPATATPTETLAKSNPKGMRRVAHVPQQKVLVRPMITSDGRSKVPPTIRQRYLNCFVDEAEKFCNSQQRAYDVAVAEEDLCHERAMNRTIYLNLAVNTVKRLRGKKLSDSIKEKLANQEEGDSPTEPSSKPLFNRPINPKYGTSSHFSVMASGGEKGTWSIQASKSTTNNYDAVLKSSSKFTKYLQQYLLTSEQLDENGYPRVDPSQKGKALLKVIDKRKKICAEPNARICARCSKKYAVDELGIPLAPEMCVYHWGRPFRSKDSFNFIARKYPCCQSESSSDGCSQADLHVSDNFRPTGLLNFVSTLPSSRPTPQQVYALDCEMSYTTMGNELTRVTVINSKKETVYDTFVLPDNPIIDYNTRFSGITAKDMANVKVTHQDVQAALLTRFNSDTILIGHSLESDLLALKIIHNTVIDTSVVFPHPMGPPRKKALRHLASDVLKKIIQNDIGGHDSAEDAITCLELMQDKVKEDVKLEGMER